MVSLFDSQGSLYVVFRHLNRFKCLIKLTMKAQQYLDQLTSEGQVSFTKEELQEALGLTPNAAACMLRRLKQKQQIASPVKGYCLVLSPEFR